MTQSGRPSGGLCAEDFFRGLIFPHG